LRNQAKKELMTTYARANNQQKPRRAGKSPTHYAKPTVETPVSPRGGGINA
jgi:hypothetical protein